MEIAPKKSDPEITMFLGRSLEYPLELNLLINPLRCELCSAKFTSPAISQVHYNSNKHQKNVRSWLWKNCFIRECEVCKVKLNSLNDFTIHCSGRKHKRQVAGVKSINPDYQDPAEQFGAQSATLNSITKRPFEEMPAPEMEQSAKKFKSDLDLKISIYRTPSGSFYCKNCNITISDKNHFEGHLKSKRHLAALKA